MLLQFTQLADAPHHLPPVATWIYEHWWRGEGRSVDVVADKLRLHTKTDQIPTTVVALDGGRPIGSACLIESDLDERPVLTPWLAALYVLPEYRSRGVGSSLVAQVEIVARNIGLAQMYLSTVNRQSLYERLGWRRMEENVGRYRQTVMMRALRP